MTYKRVIIALTPEEYDELYAIAQAEERVSSQQATFFVRQALRQIKQEQTDAREEVPRTEH